MRGGRVLKKLEIACRSRADWLSRYHGAGPRVRSTDVKAEGHERCGAERAGVYVGSRYLQGLRTDAGRGAEMALACLCAAWAPENRAFAGLVCSSHTSRRAPLPISGPSVPLSPSVPPTPFVPPSFPAPTCATLSFRPSLSRSPILPLFLPSSLSPPPLRVRIPSSLRLTRR